MTIKTTITLTEEEAQAVRVVNDLLYCHCFESMEVTEAFDILMEAAVLSNETHTKILEKEIY